MAMVVCGLSLQAQGFDQHDIFLPGDDLIFTVSFNSHNAFSLLLFIN